MSFYEEGNLMNHLNKNRSLQDIIPLDVTEQEIIS